MLVLLLLLSSLVPLHAAGLPAGLSAPEARCQRVLGPATDRLGARQALCLARCDRKARAGKVAASECSPPYGGATAACVATAGRLALRAMADACAADCPECYGDCPAFEQGAVDATGGVVAGFAADIFCDGAGSGDATAVRCRGAAAGALARVAVATGRCVVACTVRAQRGTADAAACTANPITDARTRACIERAVAAGERRLARRCAAATGCLAATLPTLTDRVRVQIESDYRSFILCASPGGAFL